MAATKNPVAHIAIIGSGIACTVTLIALFESLILGGKSRNSLLNITVIEKYHELWKGIPYGERSSVNALTITTIKDFFTDNAEREMFFKWFTSNINELLENYSVAGGQIAATWLADNREALNNQDWNNIYLPRYIVGSYIVNRLDHLTQKVESLGLASITTVQGDAIAIKSINCLKNVRVSTEDGEVLVPAKKVVVAIGSSPERKLTEAFDGHTDVLYVNSLHAKNLEDTAKSIREKLLSALKEERNVLILGSNASSIELLYLLNNTKEPLDIIKHVTLLSLSGKLPGNITYNEHQYCVTTNLDKLGENGNYTLSDLVAAATADILKVSGETVSVPDVDRIMAKTISLLSPLDRKSKKLFYSVNGVQLAKLFRRSGTDYKKAAAALASAQKLTLLKGAYSELTCNPDGSTTLSYKQNNGCACQISKVFKVVLNCMGAEDLQNTSSALIKDLLENNGCKINLSNKAFEVSQHLEAAPGIYVIGPLAGGNYNNLLHFWHLENASRIIYLSKYLAKELLKK